MREKTILAIIAAELAVMVVSDIWFKCSLSRRLDSVSIRITKE
jgi:hypothetical protein